LSAPLAPVISTFCGCTTGGRLGAEAAWAGTGAEAAAAGGSAGCCAWAAAAQISPPQARRRGHAVIGSGFGRSHGAAACPRPVKAV
jgi:hypothetical protein